MADRVDVLLIFGILSLFHLIGGAAIGAGARGRRPAPLLLGLASGVAPLYFGIERGVMLNAWGALAWQIGVVAVSALAVGLGFPGVRAFFLRPALKTLTIGAFIMLAGMLIGAWLYRRGAEAWSMLAGGLPFIFGAMWFGAGLKQLAGKRHSGPTPESSLEIT